MVILVTHAVNKIASQIDTDTHTCKKKVQQKQWVDGDRVQNSMHRVTKPNSNYRARERKEEMTMTSFVNEYTFHMCVFAMLLCCADFYFCWFTTKIHFSPIRFVKCTMAKDTVNFIYIYVLCLSLCDECVWGEVVNQQNRDRDRSKCRLLFNYVSVLYAQCVLCCCPVLYYAVLLLAQLITQSKRIAYC